MKPPLRITGLLAASLLVASACSGGDDVAPTTTEAAATEATTTTAAPATTTTSTSTTTTFAATTTTAASNAVGDMTETHEAIVAQLEIARQVSSIPEDAAAYLPDLSNPDPIVALEEAWKFENWLISVNPNPEWLRFYVLPDSPYNDEADSTLSNWLRNNWRVEDFSDTYYFEDASVIALDEAEIPREVRLTLPLGAMAVLYVQGAGERTVLDRATNEIVDTWAAYGPNTSLTILVPTESGWRIVYSDSDYAA
jgi:hypothetical protein